MNSEKFCFIIREKSTLWILYIALWLKSESSANILYINYNITPTLSLLISAIKIVCTVSLLETMKTKYITKSKYTDDEVRV